MNRPKLFDSWTEKDIAFTMRLPITEESGITAMLYFNSDRQAIGHGLFNDHYDSGGQAVAFDAWNKLKIGE